MSRLEAARGYRDRDLRCSVEVSLWLTYNDLISHAVDAKISRIAVQDLYLAGHRSYASQILAYTIVDREDHVYVYMYTDPKKEFDLRCGICLDTTAPI
jgi:hypothetical protein